MPLVVVTGAGRGFGRAVAEAFAGQGWDVIGVVRTVPSAAVPGIRWVRWDVGCDDVGPLVDAVGNRPVDVLVNNAGVGNQQNRIGLLETGELDKIMNINVNGCIRAVKALLPQLREAPAPIVLNISSRLGSAHDQAAGKYAGLSTSYAYRMSKAAQNMLTLALAHELAPQVRVWAVHPGVLATSLGQADANGDVSAAARRFVALAAGTGTGSPRFCSLGEADLPW